MNRTKHVMIECILKMIYIFNYTAIRAHRNRKKPKYSLFSEIYRDTRLILTNRRENVNEHILVIFYVSVGIFHSVSKDEILK